MSEAFADPSLAPQHADPGGHQAGATAAAPSLSERLRAAQQAQRDWAALPFSARRRAIGKARKRFAAKGEEIAQVVAQETKKPFEEALFAEVIANLELFDFWLSRGKAALEGHYLSLSALNYPGKEAYIERCPRGTIGLITPWNFPIAIPLRTLIPALLAGNSVLFKPSELTLGCARLIEEIFSGLLPGPVLHVLQGDGRLGAEIVGLPLDLVVFTGSVRVGREIAVRCAERFIPTSLELGGKDAAIVLADAPLQRTARGVAWGAFANSGQNCAGIERIYVDASVASSFLPELVKQTSALVPGRDIQPLTSRQQFDVVMAQAQDALAKGGQFLCGGPELANAEQCYFPPSLVQVPDPSAAVASRESFGPIAVVQTVSSLDEAVSLANNSPYGLTTSVWTKKVAVAERVVDHIRSGVVTINNHSLTGAMAEAPWSGERDTGGGIANSIHCLEKLTRPKLVLLDGGRGGGELYWYPYTPKLRELGLTVWKSRGGAGFFGRMVARLLLLPKLLARLFE